MSLPAILGANRILTAQFRVPAFVANLGMIGAACGLRPICADGLSISNISKDFLAIGYGLFFDAISYPVIIFAVFFVIDWMLLYKPGLAVRSMRRVAVWEPRPR